MKLIPESLSIYNPGFVFFTLFPFVKIYGEDVETRADLILLIFLNLTKNLLQKFGIVKLVTLLMHAMRVISIFNFWYYTGSTSELPQLAKIRKRVK